jgi:hypothetical protein
MIRTLLLRPLPGFVSALLLACNTSVSLSRPAHPALDQRLSQQEPAGAPAAMVLDISGPVTGSGAAGGDEQVEEVLETEQTLVAVNEDTFEEASRTLLFVVETRGSETLGVRVFFASTEAEHDEATHLGLRVADRVEEIDGLPVSGVDALARAWRHVGKNAEVHFLIRRGDRAHRIVYRQRSFGMP